MKIAIDIRHLTHPRLSGVGLYTLNVLRILSRIGGEHEFLLFASGSAKTLTRLPALPTDRFRLITKKIPNRLLFLLLTVPGGPTLESFLPEKPDCWWFPDMNIIRTKLPYALTVHDLSSVIFPQFFTWKDRLRNRIADLRGFTQRANRLLAVSQSTKIDLEEQWSIPSDRIDVTPLGVTAQYTPQRAPADQNYQRGYGLTAPYLLCLATNEPRKNLEGIIEAYNAYRLTGEHAPRLIIVGGKGWRSARLLEIYQQSPYRKDIVFLGYVHEKHKPALYRGALAFLFPSFYEGFGLPVLEAMACGTPVITSFAGALPEVTGDAAILVDPFNVSDITSALQQLLDGDDAPRLRAMLTQRGLAATKKFHWEVTGQQTLASLLQLPCPQPSHHLPTRS